MTTTCLILCLKLAWNGLTLSKIAPMDVETATMEFWKLLGALMFL